MVIEKAEQLTFETLAQMIADYDGIPARQFREQYPFFGDDLEAAMAPPLSLNAATLALFDRYERELVRASHIIINGVLGIQYNGGNGAHPFVKIHFNTISDAEKFHASISHNAAEQSA